ncbi:MAG: KpsF/GutQ family sugar-phosphate isomerase [Deltaproteobacteria bacterium]|nr:KpsF/GutQ family sugar-phosphate isomerase [Deltaproteobacteria bacterium]
MPIAAPSPTTVARPAPRIRAASSKPASASSHNVARVVDPTAEGKRVVAVEAAAIQALVDRIDSDFARAVELIQGCRGRVVVSGLGKPGFVAQKLSATFASTGTPSLYLHPAEALHGDLGRVVSGDVVLVLSNSGRTDEVLALLPSLKEIGAPVIAVTGDQGSPLGEHADVVLELGAVTEACPLGLAPTASTTAMMVLGDALAMCVAAARGLSADQFARLHPGGALGRSLLRVRDVMRAGERNPVLAAGASLSAAIAVMTRTPGRPGAAVVVDDRCRLQGIFTDGDLRRLIERSGDALDLAQPVDGLMARSPRTVEADALVGEAIRALREHAIDQVVAVDAESRVAGLLDVQDLLAARLL